MNDRMRSQEMAKKYIKSFLKKMAIMLDVVFIFIGLNNSIDVYMSNGHWIFSLLWLLFMLIFLSIAIVYLENLGNKN